jgi:hypothetical protein
MSDARPRRRRGFAFGGFVLLAGVLLLAAVTGWLPEGFWFALVPLWPVLIIAPGLNLVLSRRDARLGSGAALAVLLGAVVAAWFMGPSGWDTTTYVYQQSVARDSAEQSRIRMELPLGRVNIFGGSDPTRAMEGEYSMHVDDRRVAVASRVIGRVLEIDLESPLSGHDFDIGFIDTAEGPWERWELGLSRALETGIDFTGGVARLDLDMNELRVSDVDITVGVADIDVVLPTSAGRTEASLTVGVGEVDVEIPEGVAARIRVKGGVSGFGIDDDRFEHYSSHGDGFWVFGRNVEYRSPGYDTATNRVDIRIEVGVGDVDIR